MTIILIELIQLNDYQLLTSSRIIIKLFSLLLSIALPLNHVVANDYSQGFNAFVSGDYIQAQQYWLAAANNGDAKSMFNLGLLNEQSKIATGSTEKAEEWYRKAANKGYSAASYHLAQRLLERGGSDDDAIALIKSAAEQGYAPALRYFGDTPKSTASSAINSLAKAESKQLGKQSKRDQFQVESWINRQKSDDWTIQLLAFTHEFKVQEFIDQHGLQSKAAYFIERKDGVVWYKLIYGSFDSKDKATFARQNLSTKLQEFGPWLRTIASVQAITKG